MAVQKCPACVSDRLSAYPTSRRTGRTAFKCKDCGIAGWAGRDEVEAFGTVGLDVISVEERSAWFALKRDAVINTGWGDVLDTVAAKIGGAQGKELYDIGAGDGHFLSVARDRGFSVGGNELLEAAIIIADDQFDIELDLGDLAELDVARDRDVVTMWCVMAHVGDPDSLLRDCLSMLKPGGLFYLQTPHLCAVDKASLGALRASRGRITRWADRRIAQHHWILHSRRSMTAALERAGFTDIEIHPKARYSLAASPYLQSLGFSKKRGDSIGNAIEGILDRGWAPRIVLDAYARKPHTTSPD